MHVQQGKSYIGPCGSAQHVTVDGHPNAPAGVAAWFMHLPGQAPAAAWDKYMLAVASLDDVPGLPPPHRQYPGAEYELLLVALDPDLGPRVDDVETWMPMRPPNLVKQFHGVTREQVARMAGTLAWACVHGRLPVETMLWVQPAGSTQSQAMMIAAVVNAWGEAIDQLIEHELTGGVHGARLN
jgi:hypothetical protein